MYPVYDTPNYSGFVDNINVRQEVHRMIYGDGVNMPLGSMVILQNCIRDQNNLPVKSPYSYKLTGEGPLDRRIANTTTTGFLCTEKLIRALFIPPPRLFADAQSTHLAFIESSKYALILAYPDIAYTHDIILVPKLSDNGEIIQPVTVINEYVITKTYEKRYNNRLEFTVCILERVK